VSDQPHQRKEGEKHACAHPDAHGVKGADPLGQPGVCKQLHRAEACFHVNQLCCFFCQLVLFIIRFVCYFFMFSTWGFVYYQIDSVQLLTHTLKKPCLMVENARERAAESLSVPKSVSCLPHKHFHLKGKSGNVARLLTPNNT
jgi:hypothetical protein